MVRYNFCKPIRVYIKSELLRDVLAARCIVPGMHTDVISSRRTSARSFLRFRELVQGHFSGLGMCVFSSHAVCKCQCIKLCLYIGDVICSENMILCCSTIICCSSECYCSAVYCKKLMYSLCKLLYLVQCRQAYSQTISDVVSPTCGQSHSLSQYHG